MNRVPTTIRALYYILPNKDVKQDLDAAWYIHTKIENMSPRLTKKFTWDPQLRDETVKHILREIS